MILLSLDPSPVRSSPGCAVPRADAGQALPDLFFFGHAVRCCIPSPFSLSFAQKKACNQQTFKFSVRYLLYSNRFGKVPGLIHIDAP